MDTKNQRFIFSLRNYCVCTPQSFVTKCFPIFIVDEVKNFAANNIIQSCRSQSHTRIYVKGQSQIGDLCIKGKNTTTRSSPIGYWSKVQLQVGISGQARVVGKIPYTCNHLIVDQWILGNGDLKITWQDFCLVRGFPHLSTNQHVNLISIAFSLISDLLVPPKFACNLT